MKISTIIPVYNSERYLNKCIDSILNQSIGFKNIELILVDDGSSDNSKKIIADYQKQHKNIRYIYQKNSGQASARNKGLEFATGEFISFVDSDDWIDENMYLDLYGKAKELKCDIVTCDSMYIKENRNEYFSNNFAPDSNKNFIIMNTGPCNMIIKRDLIIEKKFKFPEGIIYEDLAIIPSLGIGSKIFLVEKPYYNYLIRANSTMNSQKYNTKLEDVFKSFDILYNNFLKQNAVEEYHEEIEFLYIRKLLMSASLRFIQFNDPNGCIAKISNTIKEKFPKWKNNSYYKKLPFKQRVVAILAYRKRNRILKILFNLNKKK